MLNKKKRKEEKNSRFIYLKVLIHELENKEITGRPHPGPTELQTKWRAALGPDFRIKWPRAESLCPCELFSRKDWCLPPIFKASDPTARISAFFLCSCPGAERHAALLRWGASGMCHVGTEQVMGVVFAGTCPLALSRGIFVQRKSELPRAFTASSKESFCLASSTSSTELLKVLEMPVEDVATANCLTSRHPPKRPMG